MDTENETRVDDETLSNPDEEAGVVLKPHFQYGLHPGQSNAYQCLETIGKYDLRIVAIGLKINNPGEVDFQELVPGV